MNVRHKRLPDPLYKLRQKIARGDFLMVKAPEKPVNNKWSKDATNFELVVRFRYGLDDWAIARVAGLRNFDTGTSLTGPDAGIRDLMFSCGTDLLLAQEAGIRVIAADHYGAIRECKISYPIETEGKDEFAPWYLPDGTFLHRVKCRKLVPRVVIRRTQAPKRKAKASA